MYILYTPVVWLRINWGYPSTSQYTAGLEFDPLIFTGMDVKDVCFIYPVRIIASYDGKRSGI